MASVSSVRMLHSSRFSARVLAAAVLALPLVTLWNITVPRLLPRLAAQVGTPVFESEFPKPIEPAFASVLSGEFQKTASAVVARAIPIRSLLIRLNNEIRYSVFNMSPVPSIVRLGHGELFERLYVDEYCGRRSGDAERLAARMVPRLLELQSAARQRGALFLYLITPSKAAHLPEDLEPGVSCESSGAARELVVRYSELLRDNHVAVLDLATMVHGMRQGYHMDMFPRGGIHWNALAAANAARAVIDAINAQAGRETLRPFDVTYHLSGDLDLLDHELESGLNLLFEHIHDQEPRVVFSAAGTCDQHDARQLTAAAVGGSFLGSLGEVLTAQGCLVQLQHYFYTRGSLFAFQPYRLVKPGLTDADLAPLRTVDILLVEENESFIGRSVHFDQLYEALAHPEHRPNQPARP